MRLMTGFCIFALLAADACAEGGLRSCLKRPESWFGGEAAKAMAANILSHQSASGGWPKNVDTSAQLFTGDRDSLKPTFDNGATTDELRFLARIFTVTQQARYRAAFEKGVDYILRAQYPSGGWPQSYPPGDQYHRHITFNDGAMARVMDFLWEAHREERYAFLDAGRREASRQAFERGIECILKCQIKVDGKLTAWCAQHDEVDYSPRPGRTFELASISGAESVQIVRLLMRLDKPAPAVVAAVEGAVAWFRSAQLNGVREVVQADPAAPAEKTHRLVKDPAAGPLWARFYDIESNRPIFSDRDGVKKFDISEIGAERGGGYRWFGVWPDKLIGEEYAQWKKKHAQPAEARPLPRESFHRPRPGITWA